MKRNQIVRNRRRKVGKQNRRTINRGNQLSRITTNNAPVSRSSRIYNSDPIISSVRRSGRTGFVSCSIRHRELVQVINGSVAFSVITIPVQPGISATFPWLANIAVNWEMYRFNRIGFRFVTRSSTAFTGSVVIAPDYDSSDSAPTTYSQISTFQNAVSDAPWKDILCELNPRSTTLVGNNRYVRNGPLGSNLDIKLYDVANLYLAVVGQASGAVIGELWVEYNITLEIPQLNGTSSQVSNLSSGNYEANNGVDVNNLLGTTAPNFLGNLVISVALNTVTVVNCVPGTWYMIVHELSATTILTGTEVMTLTSGATSFDLLCASKATLSSIVVYSALSDSPTLIFVMSAVTTFTDPIQSILRIAAYTPVSDDE